MKISVALLGATGTVGQKVLKMLKNHPIFEVTELVASERSIGKVIDGIKVISYKDVTCKYAISSLPADIARDVEKYLAQKGVYVVSNASAYRRDPTVPLIIPEINGSHMALIESQNTKGKIITNPNCSTVFLALGLKPILDFGELEHVSVVTLQALSGAGYPGVPSLDILGNTIPNISGEEEKLEWEANKILGETHKLNNLPITASVNRVPVIDGHSVVIHATFKNAVSAIDVQNKFKELAQKHPELYCYYEDSFHPQPRDLDEFDYRAHIGKIKQGASDRVVTVLSVGHNLVRGAAGAAILNLQLLTKYLGDINE